MGQPRLPQPRLRLLNRLRTAVPTLAVLLILTLLAACSGQPAAAGADADSRPLLVFAAASLKESLDEAAAAYTAAGGPEVQVSYAASSALARQIAQGAPADAFVSADLEWMDWLQQRELVDADSRRDLLGNALVLVAPASGNPAPVDLATAPDLRPRLGGGRLALALVESVPAGKYARQAFESLGMWTTLAPHVAEGDSVRAALMLVARGEAPLGVVYASDARAEPRVQVVATFPADSHPPIVYPVARVAASRHAGAMEFIAWLGSPAAGEVFRRHGFSLR